jgi:general secretion pathway protein H
MQTLVPGRGRQGDANRRVPYVLAGEQGFTLMELLVVMLLIGILLATIQLQLFDDTGRRLHQEGERLAALLAAVHTEAMTRGERLGVRLEAEGYAVARQDAESAAWQPLEAEVFRPHRLPEGMRIAAIQVDGQALALGERLIYPPSGLAPPLRIDLAAEQERVRLVGDAVGRIRIE